MYVHVSPGMDVLESFSISLDEYTLVTLYGTEFTALVNAYSYVLCHGDDF